LHAKEELQMPGSQAPKHRSFNLTMVGSSIVFQFLFAKIQNVTVRDSLFAGLFVCRFGCLTRDSS